MTDLGKMGSLGQGGQRLKEGRGGCHLPLACQGLSESTLVVRPLRRLQPAILLSLSFR